MACHPTKTRYPMLQNWLTIQGFFITKYVVTYPQDKASRNAAYVFRFSFSRGLQWWLPKTLFAVDPIWCETMVYFTHHNFLSTYFCPTFRFSRIGGTLYLFYSCFFRRFQIWHYSWWFRCLNLGALHSTSHPISPVILMCLILAVIILRISSENISLLMWIAVAAAEDCSGPWRMQPAGVASCRRSKFSMTR